MWRAVDPPPFIYWTAITLTETAQASVLANAHGTVCDSWSSLDLTPFGFGLRDRDGLADRAREPWFMRPNGRLDGEQAPPELEVVRATTPTEVAEFETVSMLGFAGEDARVEVGTLHPPSILRDARMTMLIGRVEGNGIAAAMGYESDGAVGIYGVTTVASARGRGYASALTRALIDAGRPTILSPSREAENLYRRLGFEQVGELCQWQRS